MTSTPISILAGDFFALALDGQVELAVTTLLAPTITWDNPLPDPIPFGGRWQEHRGVIEYIRTLLDNVEIEAFDITDTIEHHEYLTLIGTETSVVKRTKRRYTMRWAHVIRAENNRVVEWQEFNDTAAMLRAFE